MKRIVLSLAGATAVVALGMAVNADRRFSTSRTSHRSPHALTGSGTRGLTLRAGGGAMVGLFTLRRGTLRASALRAGSASVSAS